MAKSVVPKGRKFREVSVATMCGIVGLWGKTSPHNESHLIAMRDRLAHRGPDAAGAWLDEKNGVAMGHRRLSVIDLSPNGAQPMHSHCGRFVLTYNGEIYNFKELRIEIEKQHPELPWRGGADTEVVLAAVNCWGLDGALQRMNGMFALGIWDRTECALYLARDRFGEKPLYYGYAGRDFVFASELRALRAHSSFEATVDRTALTSYFRFGYVPAPLSIYEGIHKLLPGHWLRIGQADMSMRVLPEPEPYWQLDELIDESRLHPFEGSETDGINQLENLLKKSVGEMMVSDVPLGAFLSGGVDSSTVVALMQTQSNRPVKTFSIGFHDQDFNEAQHANAVAKHLGTEHQELYVTPSLALEVVPLLQTIYDEPFSDASQIPTHLLAKFAKGHVTVSLSGDGGDELFCGYSRYGWVPRIWRAMAPFPAPARRAVGRAAASIPAAFVDSGYAIAKQILPHRLRFNHASEKWAKAAALIQESESSTLYRRVVSSWADPNQLVSGGKDSVNALELSMHPTSQLDLREQMMRFDAMTYLPDDILVKVDRASMGVSLEARVPMLNQKVVEFAWRLPMHMKIRHGVNKWVLREVLYRHVPRELIERPKMGFGVPIHQWLRGALRDWAETLLNEDLIRRQGFLNAELVRNVWEEHLSGQRNWQRELWTVLMFQAWLTEQ